jgi:hypothetical protein
LSQIAASAQEAAVIITGEFIMNIRLRDRSLLCTCAGLCALLLGSQFAAADQPERAAFVLTSTNAAAGNQVLVFSLQTQGPPALSFVNALQTGGKGGASGNAGILQFDGDLGAVANYGSNTVSPLTRHGDFIGVETPIGLAPGCEKPDSVALARDHLFVVGANCAESHAWPSGGVDGGVVHLNDASAAQIAIGKRWGAVTFTSGALIQLALQADGALGGETVAVTLPSGADNTPLGAAFWNDILGFTPAHSPESFAIVDAERNVYPITGPTPPYPTNAPCWVAKGPESVWYTGNSPGKAISIFFSDDRGGVFYKSIPLPGAPTDVAVSADKKWLAVIYTAEGAGYVAVFAIDRYGNLTLAATSEPIGVAAFSGVAFSQ